LIIDIIIDYYYAIDDTLDTPHAIDIDIIIAIIIDITLALLILTLLPLFIDIDY
jgi:hypothetical protein